MFCILSINVLFKLAVYFNMNKEVQIIKVNHCSVTSVNSVPDQFILYLHLHKVSQTIK